MIDALAPQVVIRQPPQLSVNQRHQPIERRLVAVAPILQQLCDTLWRLHRRSLHVPQRNFSKAPRREPFAIRAPCQRLHRVPMAIQSLGSDERLLTQVTQVTRTRIGGPVVVVPEVARRDHSKGAHSGQRSAFRAAS